MKDDTMLLSSSSKTFSLWVAVADSFGLLCLSIYLIESFEGVISTEMVWGGQFKFNV